MFSNKENVNMLTALMLKHGINTMVLCPGSRNTPLLHNFNECAEMQCFSVTDERSAGFYALGLAQNTHKKVGICVTSGSALLNVLPAVAEAFYQKIPFVVISADRPLAWINQLDGQTLPQTTALKQFVSCEVTLNEPSNDIERWHNNRLINQALLAFNGSKKIPVHINIPISEPLFQFDCAELPNERKVESIENNSISVDTLETIAQTLRGAEQPMIVVGQGFYTAEDAQALKEMAQNIVVLAEPLSGVEGIQNFDEVLASIENANDYAPDALLYVGNSVVSKRLKSFLREQKGCYQMRIAMEETLEDTFMNLSLWVKGSAEGCFNELKKRVDMASYPHGYQLNWATLVFQNQFVERWNTASQRVLKVLQHYQPCFSQLSVIKLFEEKIAQLKHQPYVHYANSTAVRLANVYAKHFVYCNRGVNGIEGCLSTAAGMSLSTSQNVFCVIGDLAFFYDQNALWNNHLKGNFRVILLNNGGGGIFNMLAGASKSGAHSTFIKAEHHTNAQGICAENGIVYLSASNEEECVKALNKLLKTKHERPVLLEVFTLQQADADALSTYYKKIKQQLTKHI